MRVVLTILSLKTSFRAARNLWFLCLDGAAYSVPGLVLAVEVPTNFVFAAALGCGAGTWSSGVSNSVHWLFATGLVGSAAFTSLAMALFCYRRNKERQQGLALRSFHPRRRLLPEICGSSDAVLLALIAMVTVGAEFAISVAGATHALSKNACTYSYIFYLLFNLICAGLLTSTAYGSFVAIRKERFQDARVRAKRAI